MLRIIGRSDQQIKSENHKKYLVRYKTPLRFISHTCISLCKTFPGSLKVPFPFWYFRIQSIVLWMLSLLTNMYGLAWTNDFKTNADNLKTINDKYKIIFERVTNRAHLTGLKIEVLNWINIRFLFLKQTIYCGYSKEWSQWDSKQ